MLSKLLGNIREKWNKNAMNIRRRHSREADFADLIHFVDDEAKLGNDPLFSKEVLVISVYWSTWLQNQQES